MSPTVANPEAGENEDLILNLNEPDPPDPEKGKTNGDGAGDKAVVTKPPPVPGPTSAQTGLADLEKQIETDRAERSRLEADNRRLQGERDHARVQAQEAERRGITTSELNAENQIKAATDKMDVLSEQHAAAMNDGDFTKAAEIQKQSNRLGGQLALLERDKAMLAHQREQVKQRQASVAEITDPRELVIAGRTQRTQAFLRKHTDYLRSDGTFRGQVLDAHYSAVELGFVPDTDAYFEHIEKKVGGGGAPKSAGEAPLGAPTTAAPVERGAGPGSNAGGPQGEGTFRITPAMQRLAAEQGVTPQEWAKGFLQKKREGKIPMDWMPT